MDLGQYFVYDYHGAAFEWFGPAHVATLLALAALILGLLTLRSQSERARGPFRWTLALLLWLNEAGWHIWNISWGHWTIDQLPLHICSLLIWLSGIMLVCKNRWIYEFAYFLGIGGGLQALLTPDVGIWGFPHYRFFQTFIAHGLLIAAAVYMTTVEGLRPTWKSLLRVFVGMNLYMALVYIINLWLGTNFLYINAKPAVPTLLDLLPPWPGYLPWMETIGVAVCLLLYLPFAIGDWRTRRKSRIAPR
ncbi:MAG: TIGR02206 family membrane protein [Anaerolineales bacterium]|nr:TIGR02206 family membrane protein [Anaerolineales bacterium]